MRQTEDDTRYFAKNETVENLNSRLATNCTSLCIVHSQQDR